MGRYEIKPADGSRSNRKRLGRGPGSGRGKTAGKGHKGQKARSGHKNRPWFEGGQMPLQRRVPKRGFTNPFHKVFQVVNLKDLEKVKGGEIDRAALREVGLIRSVGKPVKILGEGSIERKVTVRVDAFSEAARRAIEAAGGSCVEERAVTETKTTETTETGA
ncbi:50S ribosomal protein L15 [Gemmatimonadota bacterium]